jgi:N-acetylglucosamine kinase-like BadF-type ATPase
MSIYIGIEGVGLRHSIAVAADAEGKITASCRLVGEPLSLHTIDRNLLRSRLMTLIREVARGASRSLNELRDATVCIGLSGVTFPYDAVVDLREEFEKLEIPVLKLICTGDAEIVFASHAQILHGSAILCHMGSTAFITTPEHHLRYGGWGPAFGDQGSGYWIGLQALTAISEDFDSGRPESILWKIVEVWLGSPARGEHSDWVAASLIWRKFREKYITAPNRYDLRTALFHFAHAMTLQRSWQWRAVVSSLSIPVVQAHTLGDPSATAILQRAASHLVRQYQNVCKRAAVRPIYGPLVLYGGVILHNPEFQSMLVSQLREIDNSAAEIISPKSDDTMRPALGALLYALGDSDSGHLRLPSQKVIDSVVNEQKHLHRSGDLCND